MKFQMFKLVLEKVEEPGVKLPTSIGKKVGKTFYDPLDHRKIKDSRKTSTSASVTPLKPLTVWITKNGGEF